MKNSKTQKGITLLALIITIIVLLILAIVSIKILTDHKIITFANKSVKDYQKAQNDETSKLNDVAKIMSNINNKQTVDLTGKYYENGNTAAGIYYEIKDNKIITIQDGQITETNEFTIDTQKNMIYTKDNDADDYRYENIYEDNKIINTILFVNWQENGQVYEYIAGIKSDAGFKYIDGIFTRSDGNSRYVFNSTDKKVVEQILENNEWKDGKEAEDTYYIINNIAYNSAGKVIGKFTSQNVLELDGETYTKNN